MSIHTLFLESLPPPDTDALRIEGEEARHAARVKRLREGAELRLIDGKGSICRARVVQAKRTLDVELLEREQVAPVVPRLELCTATPKGPRLDKMIDMASQLGVAAWRPLDTALGVVEPGAGKQERMRRIAIESAKQSGRAWLMAIGKTQPFPEALEAPHVVLADANGGPYTPTGADTIRVLVGPEGGFTASEIAAAAAAGATPVSLGQHTLRIETAAVAAAAVILHAEGARPDPPARRTT